MGHVVEIQEMEHRNSKQTIQRIDSDMYMVLATGEVKDYNKTENRGQSINSLRQTFRKLRGVINSNFSGSDGELHITLTYRENMTDVQRLYKDFKKFMGRLKYSIGQEIAYISVVEPQGRGAWHCHLLIKTISGSSLYLPSGEIYGQWGHGFIKVKSLKGVDNIGAYLSAYLADVEVTDESAVKGLEVVEKIVDGTAKRFIKGGRLHLYPSGMNIYRTSRNIKRPTEEMMTYEKAKSANGLAEPVYTSKIQIVEEEYRNTVQYEQYNIKRK